MPRTGKETAPAALERLRLRAGLSVTELAKQAGYRHASGIQRYLDPQVYTEPVFPLRLLGRLSGALVGRGDPPITSEELYIDLAGVVPQEDETTVLPNAVNAPEKAVLSPRSMDRDIRVLGVGAAGTSGDFRFNGDEIDLVRRPPGIANRKGIFAVYVQGESMVPWRQPGELVYVDTARAPKAGDHILLECHPARPGESGDAYLKRLVAITPNKIILEQYNPRNDHIEVNRAKVLHLYRVIEWSELLGI